MKFKSVFILLLFAFAGFTVVYAEDTRTITDMVGRQVTVPTEIDSVLGTSPPTSEAVYMINPDTLIGLNFAFNDTNYVSEKYRNLPNVGGQQMGNALNYETFLSMKPDIILFGSSPGTNVSDTIDDMQRKLYPIPVVGVIDATNAKEYGPGIIFLGDLLDQKEKASELNTFYDTMYKTVTEKVATIPEDQRVRVYYAEGPDGLKTDPEVSDHAQLITICGGKNVAEVNEKGAGGMSPVSIEQVLSWNPDLILAGDSRFYKSVLSDPNWKDINAVKNKNVFLIPNQPFGWIDRPPGVNRIIGIPWLAQAFYPDLFADMDLSVYIKEFYSKFYHYDLSDDEINDIITSSGLSREKNV
ncbi:MAG: ABC transporter substrate-binding protein [Methanospirillum sp.]|uniref:ABC transporter substrate-binding protein n=1 Tax=Methanospirillum sp. TaxID=45200 RepID=UPI00236DE0A8|nr:ABC transporter substrate-binding protein [Methanospirillum sp.]MDD1727878.1 ABC transporter substrate-binding protein [Methanospirillum sp.]